MGDVGHWMSWGLELGQGDLRDEGGYSRYFLCFMVLSLLTLLLGFSQNLYETSTHLYMPSWILNIQFRWMSPMPFDGL